MKQPLWEDILAAPAYVINLDRCPDRWNATRDRLEAAGYRDIRRFVGVDAAAEGDEGLLAHLRRHGQALSWAQGPANPDADFMEWPGKRGCLLSHLHLWRHILDDPPMGGWATVFEDDLAFHEQWADLAPRYWEATPADADLVYLGHQLDAPSGTHIDRAPVWCTHAMLWSTDGIAKAYRSLLGNPGGLFTIDYMLKLRFDEIRHYVWNGLFFPSKMAQMDKGWSKRNCGLVFQDVAWGSDVRTW